MGKFRFILASVLALLAGCSGRVSKAGPAVDEAARAAGDTARFLAGMRGRPDGSLRKAESSDAWKAYAAEFDATWAHLEQGQLAAVDAFRKRELAPVAGNGKFTFYPFSGPDVLYATRLFPDSEVYVMAGLEPVGNLKPPQAYSVDRLPEELQGWRKSVSSIFERSFFVTGEMERQFRGQVADGILPTILLLLARSGHGIEGIRYGVLDAAGKFGAEVSGAAAPRQHQGVEIRFRRGSEPVSRRMYYFSTNLAEPFQTEAAFARFLRAQGRPVTLVKSASFLLHWKKCGALRQYILDESDLILEDDTGIPYGYFQPAEWQVELFGEYSRPDRPFQREYQRDLAEAFRAPGRARPLGFSLGYGYGRRPSSMLLARRVRGRQ